jgi:hypothetical protein
MGRMVIMPAALLPQSGKANAVPDRADGRYHDLWLVISPRV